MILLSQKYEKTLGRFFTRAYFFIKCRLGVTKEVIPWIKRKK